LRLILDSHERIAIGHESGFMRAVQATKCLPDYIYGDGWYRRFGVTDDEMNRRISAFYSSIFRDHAHSQGKVRWGEKTPDNVFLIDEMAVLWPDSQFVCMVRHPVRVVASLLRWNWDFDEALAYWLRAHDATNQAAKWGDERWRVVRYEDLVADPRRTLAQILDFLHEPWSESLLNHHSVQRDRHGPGEVEGDTRNDRAIDLKSLDRWQEQLTTAQLHDIEVATAEARLSLGFHDSPEPAI
jgi:hypothetical protein